MWIYLFKQRKSEWHIYFTQFSWLLSTGHWVPLLFLWWTIRKSAHNFYPFQSGRHFSVSFLVFKNYSKFPLLIIANHILLIRNYSCTTETASDYVEFSNYKTVDRKIPRHCGSKKPVNIESDGDFFRITFKSNDRFDDTGFKAYYEFKKPEGQCLSRHNYWKNLYLIFLFFLLQIKIRLNKFDKCQVHLILWMVWHSV